MPLLTKEECDKIVENSEAFYKTTRTVNNTEVVQYNYRIAGFKDFKEYNAFDMRGLTFVKEGDTYKRYLMLHKFFNLMQPDAIEDYNLENILNMEKQHFLGVDEKVDGSMIRFVNVNGQMFAKTKMDFFNPQTELAEQVLKTQPKLLEWLKEIDGKYAAIFEIVSIANRIVVPYEKTELILLQIRNEETGEYVSLDFAPDFVKKINRHNKTIIELIEEAKIVENMEGWVINFSNNFKVKIKTEWYKNLHRLMTGSCILENNIIELVLEEKIDDVLGELPDGPVKDYAIKINEFVSHYINHLTKEITNVVLSEIKLNLNKKDLALKYKEHKYFNLIVSSYPKDVNNLNDINNANNVNDISESVLEERIFKDIIKFVSKQTNKMLSAQNWLKDNGFVAEKVMVDFE